jgi:hypothetical protein
MVVSKYKTIRESILTTPSANNIKKEMKIQLTEIGRYTLLFLAMFYVFMLFGLI